MIRNYIKIAWRNISRNKLFSAINITGLSVGVSCCVLIFLYVQYEMSFDTFNVNANRLYRLTVQMHQPQENNFYSATSPRLAPAIQAAFPEVEKSSRIIFSKRILSYGQKKFYDTRIMFADSALLQMFTFPMIEGNPDKALVEPYSIVLTEGAAKNYFGPEPAMGKMMQLSDTIQLKVTGIIRDIPANAHFNFSCVVSRSTLSDMTKATGGKYPNEDDWFFLDSHSYVLLKENTDHQALEKKIDGYIQKQMAPERKEYGMWLNTYLQPLKDIHLKSNYEAEIKPETNSDIRYVYIFSGTALLILLIACSNFINLSTAKSLNRSKEIGLRKVIGAKRGQLIAQFLGESLILTVIASVISILLVLAALPGFNTFTQRQLSLNGTVFFAYAMIICGVGLLAGLYPAIFMSSFSPVKALKGHIRHGWKDIFLRRGLVVFQFTIAVALIIGTTLILKQLNYMQNKKLGMNKDQILQVDLLAADMPKAQTLMKEFARNPQVINTTLNDFSFKGIPAITMLPDGAAQNELVAHNVISVDENFLKTFQIELVAGRDFSKDFPSDIKEAFIVNEAAVKSFNWGSSQKAIGKKIDWAFGKSGKVIGVVKDFNYSSLHNNISPLIIHIFPPFQRRISVRLRPDHIPQTVSELETTWKSLVQENPFKYEFMEENYNGLYLAEMNMRSVLSAFTILSVFVACLGLFGLAAFTIRQRVKEIGIRKVLGAGIRDIVQLLSKDFLKLVLISVIIAVPVAWFAIERWLRDFAYKTNIGAGIFIYAGITALIITFLTVSIQAIKAALVNPVKSFRVD